jgi:hypothetical protein
MSREQFFPGRRRDDPNRSLSRFVGSIDPLATDMDVTDAYDVAANAWIGDAAAPVQLVELPSLLTIRQAAEVLWICPAKAYQAAHRNVVIRLGRSMRVPRLALLVLAQTGRVVSLSELEVDQRNPLGQQSRRRVSIRLSAGGAPRAVPRSRPSAVRAGGDVGRSSGRRRVGSVEQLRLLPGD